MSAPDTYEYYSQVRAAQIYQRHTDDANTVWSIEIDVDGTELSVSKRFLTVGNVFQTCYWKAANKLHRSGGPAVIEKKTDLNDYEIPGEYWLNGLWLTPVQHYMLNTKLGQAL
jgi:hypothetical protein